MADSTTQEQWLEKIVALFCARDGVTRETKDDGGIALAISYDGTNADLVITRLDGNFRAQKNQYTQIRETLTALGIKEGAEYQAPKRARKPPSPQMLAARAKQRKEFDAWQEIWRTLRQAEQALDVEYEIAQMKDYY